MRQEKQEQLIPLETLKSSSFNRDAIKKETAWDKFGVSVSTACTIKCIGLPLVTAALPSLGALSTLSHSPAAHWGVVALALPGAAQLFYDGVKNEKQRGVNTIFASTGMTLMAMGAIGHTLTHGDHASHGAGHDHSNMDHSTMDHSKMDHSAMGHDMSNMKSEVKEPAAIVYDPNASQKTIGDISHYSFLIGGLILGAGHLKRFLNNRNALRNNL